MIIPSSEHHPSSTQLLWGMNPKKIQPVTVLLRKWMFPSQRWQGFSTIFFAPYNWGVYLTSNRKVSHYSMIFTDERTMPNLTENKSQGLITATTPGLPLLKFDTLAIPKCLDSPCQLQDVLPLSHCLCYSLSLEHLPITTHSLDLIKSLRTYSAQHLLPPCPRLDWVPSLALLLYPEPISIPLSSCFSLLCF